MTDLLKALYTYAQENRITYPSDVKLQIQESSRISEKDLERLTEHLSEKDRELLENYIGEEALKDCLEREAVFRAGVSIGLELSRL